MNKVSEYICFLANKCQQNFLSCARNPQLLIKLQIGSHVYRYKMLRNFSSAVYLNKIADVIHGNFGFHGFVCLIKRYLQKRSIKRKKKKNKMFTAEVEPGPSDCHNSTISTWPPQLPVISYGIFDLITQYNCTRSLLGSLFLQNFQKICVN